MKRCNNCTHNWYHYIIPKQITLFSPKPIFRWLFWVYDMDKQQYRDYLRKHNKQHTFIYCPKCDMELISSNAVIEHDLKKDPYEYFVCKSCGTLSKWNFDLPCPILLQSYNCIDVHKFRILEKLGYYDNL